MYTEEESRRFSLHLNCAFLLTSRIIFFWRSLPLHLDHLVASIAESVHHPHLKRLANQVPGIILKSRAENTVKKYRSYYNSWEDWCKTYNITAIPAKEKHVALYLVNLLQNKKSSHVIESTFYAIEYYHKLNLCNSPFTSHLCLLILEAAKRQKTKRNKKEPITARHLRKIYISIGKSKNCTTLDLRTFAMMVLSYTGFLRYSEVSDLKASDIKWKKTHIELFIEKSKTDIYRDGHWLLISKLNSPICPLRILKRYLVRTDTHKNSNKFLFRGMNFFKNSKTHKLRKKNKPLSYSAARSNMLDMVTKIGLKRKNFGLHSLRSGGATAAANEGVPDRLFKRHGRWKSEKAKDGYIKDKLSDLLSVSMNLGL